MPTIKKPRRVTPAEIENRRCDAIEIDLPPLVDAFSATNDAAEDDLDSMSDAMQQGVRCPFCRASFIPAAINTHIREEHASPIPGPYRDASLIAGKVLSAMLIAKISRNLQVKYGPVLRTGPLGGRSHQLKGIFTDGRGQRHGVLINIYCGAPDVEINAKDEPVGKKQARKMKR